MNGLNLSKFKKIASDDRSTTLKSPEGHKIVVAHHALSPELRKKVKEIPTKYADGGEVDDDSADRSPASLLRPETAQAASDKKLGISATERAALNGVKANEGAVSSDVMGPVQPAPSLFQRIDNALSLPGEQEEEALKQWQQGNAADQAKMAAPVAGPGPASLAAPGLGTQGAAPVNNSDPMGMDAYAQNMMGALGEQKAGFNQEAAAQGTIGKEQAAAEQAQQQYMQRATDDYQKHYQDLTNEYHAVMQDVKDQHINPTHYMESMSSGKKVATAIGLILGGMGSGLTGGENLAAKFLQQQIERDVDAQKANLGKSENLMNFNLKQFGNMHDATQMTLAMQNGIYSAKLKEAAAKAMDPLSRARALQMAGQLDAQAAPVLQQLAMKKAALSGLQGVGDPSQKIRFGVMSGIIPKEESEHLYKELGDAQNMVKARDNILSAFDKIKTLNTPGNRAMSPLQSTSQINAIKNPIVAALSKETAGRFTEQDSKFLDTLFPSVTDNQKSLDTKRAQVERLISEKMHFPRLQAFGISPTGEQRYGDGGQKKIQLGPPVR